MGGSARCDCGLTGLCRSGIAQSRAMFAAVEFGAHFGRVMNRVDGYGVFAAFCFLVSMP